MDVGETGQIIEETGVGEIGVNCLFAIAVFLFNISHYIIIFILYFFHFFE